MHITIDQEAGTAYVTLRVTAVSRTVEVSETTMVDLDEHGVVVGIEFLSLSVRDWDSTAVLSQCHVPEDLQAPLVALLSTLSRENAGPVAATTGHLSQVPLPV